MAKIRDDLVTEVAVSLALGEDEVLAVSLGLGFMV